MRNPNGFGSVYKLSGKRRKPWVAAKTLGWDIDEKSKKVKQIQKPIGYFVSKAEALTALVNYNENPYDLNSNTITFKEVYEKWTEQYFPTLSSQSSIRTVTAAFKYCEPLYNMRMIDIKVNHLESTIANADVGNSTKCRIKSIFNLMYKFALKNEIVDKDYSAMCDTVKREPAQIVRIPFSYDELQVLWNNLNFPFVDMVLIGIFSGWRPQELSILKIADIDLEEMTFKGGLKSDAGKNRIVPIHPLIQNLVQLNYDKAVAMNSQYLFNDEFGQQGTHMTYDKYRNRWNKIMKRFDMEHKPHDTRHTFITNAKKANMNDYIIKLIVGHAINDVTEKTYTHRTIQDLKTEIAKITEETISQQ